MVSTSLSGERRKGGRAGTWLLALLPLVLLAGLLLAIVRFGPAEAIRGEAPPVEVLTFQQVRLTADGFEAVVLNDGPDPVTVAQVMVDEAYWSFAIEPPGRPLDHLERATVRIPYPWVAGEAHALRLVSSTGVTFDHEVAVAVATPRPSWRFAGVFALIGIYVGVLPVALGLLWYPLLSRLTRRGVDFVLALTIGLLLFLLVDTVHEGLEAAGGMPSSYQGLALLVFSALAAFVGIEVFGERLRGRGAQAGSAWAMALLVAIGIGLHNFGEGLAIGAAFALGEAALGTLLILGFTLHNTTEGLAIVAPLAEGKARVSVASLALLGAIAGVPTLAGAWLGGFVYSPLWAAVFLGVGAGAIAQVVVQIGGAMARERSLGGLVRSAAVASGLLLGVAVMYATGMLVG
jgi:zinc transporter ZupT